MYGAILETSLNCADKHSSVVPFTGIKFKKMKQQDLHTAS